MIPTSNHNLRTVRYIHYWLYIFWFLHQTTTQCRYWHYLHRCISFDSYIKPQLQPELMHNSSVVYLLIPTSNHNRVLASDCNYLLYIFWFLHQTTTCLVRNRLFRCCISFDSYIKPQLQLVQLQVRRVVYLLIPTSNHNLLSDLNNYEVLYIFWFLHQTTTHILLALHDVSLYIFWFLHQTTTETM